MEVMPKRQTKNPQPRAKATQIDWIEARKFYMEDATRSYQDVADKFGVTLRGVEFQAKTDKGPDGKPTTWAILRKFYGEQASQQHEQGLVAEKSTRGHLHGQYYRKMQDLVMQKIDALGKGVPLLSSRGKAVLDDNGKPFMILADGFELEKTARALQISINGERVILGLPTTVAALTGKDGEELGKGWAGLLAQAAKVAANADASGS